MRAQLQEPIILPALRGTMGDWVYYSCLADMPTLACRVSFADEVHESYELSAMIQRTLNMRRSVEIAEFLETRPDRLFNALVVATYGGQPSWFPLKEVKKRPNDQELVGLSEDNINSVGFLTFRGDEKLFAIDGQHRLAGIKKAVNKGLADHDLDRVPLVVVAHQTTPEGVQRTRRLFSTLNKTAKPVTKFEVIALDEDDTMAITLRRLIASSSGLRGSRISFVTSNNLPATDMTSLTTIVNLYDILSTWFTKATIPVRLGLKDLKRSRLSDENLEFYFEQANLLFEELGRGFPELGEFFMSAEPESVVRKYRSSKGGSILFRPIGLHIFVTLVALLTVEMDLKTAVAAVAKLPRSLAHPPYLKLMWDPASHTILRFNPVTLRELLLYMLGRSKLSGRELQERYRKEVGNGYGSLPAPVL